MFKNALFLITLFALFSCSGTSEKKAESTSQDNDSELSSKNIAFNDQIIDGHPVEHYLEMGNMDELVLQYYHGNLEVAENAETDSLLNTLINSPQNTLPFYYKCFMNICENADSTMEDYLGNYCISLLENQTRYCVQKLKQGHPDYFTGLVANAVYSHENWEEEINDLSLKLHLNLEEENPDLRKELDLFLVGVKNDTEHMPR